MNPGWKGLRQRSQAGTAALDTLIYAFIVVVLLVGAYAINRSGDGHRQMNAFYSTWGEDKPGHDKAVQQQQSLQTPILVYIYAPWCPHCKAFSANVLSDPSVQRFFQKYPHVRIAPDHGQAERKLMADYGAAGYPTFYVVLANGRRVVVETFITVPEPRQKTPQEFITSVEQVIRGEK